MDTREKKYFSNKIIPVEYYKKVILRTILKFQVTIVQAETGSGKTLLKHTLLTPDVLICVHIVKGTHRTMAKLDPMFGPRSLI